MEKGTNLVETSIVSVKERNGEKQQAEQEVNRNFIIAIILAALSVMIYFLAMYQKF
ncbi:MAG: hypothetical protein H6Q74_2631 [Firmicutes bacterium]|nr:hypothetical protein [Bacillota bacterium]